MLYFIVVKDVQSVNILDSDNQSNHTGIEKFDQFILAEFIFSLHEQEHNLVQIKMFTSN